MVLYTPIPREVIFPQQPAKNSYYRFGNSTLCGTNEADGFHVSRIISTDLSAYTESSVTVGTVLKKKNK